MRTRTLAAVSAAVVITVLLAGCTAAAEKPAVLDAAPPVDLCAAAAPAGAASDAVEVTGEVGSPASVSLPGPLAVPTVERTVIVEGGGAEIDGAELVDYATTVYDAATGAELQREGYDGAPLLPLPAASMAALLGCATVGSRIVVAAPATENEGATVRVLDVLGARAGRATGAEQKHVDGMPDVEAGADGAPRAITIPGSPPPSQTQAAVLKAGDGAVIAPGDTVMLHYVGVRWSDGTVFGSSWSQGAPATLATTDAIAGYRTALEGQKVGSQVLAVIPPAEAYGEGEINQDDLTGETLVVVIDILASIPAQG